jgi:hypothetical protein
VLRNCDVRFVSGHEFTRAEESLEKFQGSSSCKAWAGAEARFFLSFIFGTAKSHALIQADLPSEVLAISDPLSA